MRITSQQWFSVFSVVSMYSPTVAANTATNVSNFTINFWNFIEMELCLLCLIVSSVVEQLIRDSIDVDVWIIKSHPLQVIIWNSYNKNVSFKLFLIVYILYVLFQYCKSSLKGIMVSTNSLS